MVGSVLEAIVDSGNFIGGLAARISLEYNRSWLNPSIDDNSPSYLLQILTRGARPPQRPAVLGLGWPLSFTAWTENRGNTSEICRISALH